MSEEPESLERAVIGGLSCAVIALELAATGVTAPYSTRRCPAYELQLNEAQPPVRLVIWPSLSRVDLYRENWQLVCKGIATAEILPGIEVLFRRAAGGHLFVTRSGQAAFVA